MQVGTFILLTVFIGAMLLVVQRSEPKRRTFVAIIMLLIGELIRRYIWYRDVHIEGWIALVVAVILNFSFWLFIGRYNPVIKSDKIQVIGMDD